MKALVFYQKNYRYTRKLRGPVNDATEIADILKERGFEVGIEDRAVKIPKDTDLVYMSGHGTIYEDEGVFLCPQPNRSRRLSRSDIIMGEDIPADCIVILDSCYSGAFRNLTSKSLVRSAGFQQLEAQNKVIGDVHKGIFACTKDSVAQDVPISAHFHGAFTYTLITALIANTEISDLDHLHKLTIEIMGTLHVPQHPIVKCENLTVRQIDTLTKLLKRR